MGKRPLLSGAIASYALAAHVYAIFTILPRVPRDEPAFLSLIVFTVISSVCTVLEYLSIKPSRFRVILVFHAITLALGQYVLSLNILAVVAIVGGALASIAIYEDPSPDSAPS